MSESGNNDAFSFPEAEQSVLEFWKENNTFKKQDVTLGLSDGINVEILEGINEGDKIKVWNKVSKEN